MKTYIANCQMGYFADRRRVTVDHPIRGHEYSQCGWNQRLIDDNGILRECIQFVSYETIVLEIIDGWLHCYGTFSQTTRKQIGWFIREMAWINNEFKTSICHYFTAKDSYEKNIEINLCTGETRPATMGITQTVGTRV